MRPGTQAPFFLWQWHDEIEFFRVDASLFIEVTTMRFPVLAALILATAAVAGAQTAAPWDYAGKRGPLVWGKLDPAYKTCSAGHEQWPIGIRGLHLNKALR